MLILTASPTPESASKGHLNWFNRFCTDQRGAQQTVAQMDHSKSRRL